MDAPAFDLTGASVLVVGASGGLGEPLTRLLGERGARLTLAARDEEKLRASAPHGATVVRTDLRDAAACDDVVRAAVAAHGRLDGVVCIAGVVAFGPLVELSDDTLAELVETNLLGPVRLMRAAVPHLRAAVSAGRGGGAAPGGAFVLNVSAVIAESPVAGMAAYGASKAALWAFDAAMARELRSARIRVIDARPPHTESGLANHPIAGTAPQLPQGLRPDDVALRLVRGIASGERDLPSQSFTA